MARLSKKELEKLRIQMSISSVRHDRPSVGRPAIFQGETAKRSRRNAKNYIRNYSE